MIAVNFAAQQNRVGATLMYSVSHTLTGRARRKNMLGHGQGVTGVVTAGANQ